MQCKRLSKFLVVMNDGVALGWEAAMQAFNDWLAEHENGS